MNRPLTALITNDDGIDSPGLHRLAQAALEAGLEVVIAAPATEASGSSASITVTEKDGRILYERREIAALPGVEAFAVEAGPGLIALLAGHGSFGTAPDLVLSGINRGINVGQVILHSGTVGAALTGGVNGLRALAVSQEVPVDDGEVEDEEPDWSAAAALAQQLIPQLAEQTGRDRAEPQRPDRPGGRRSRAADGNPRRVRRRPDHGDREGRGLRRLRPPGGVLSPGRPRPGSDAALLADGYASLTALRSVAEDTALPLEELVSRARAAR